MRIVLLRWIGISASVRQSINIGCNLKIGAGAAVLTEIDVIKAVIGVPASGLGR